MKHFLVIHHICFELDVRRPTIPSQKKKKKKKKKKKVNLIKTLTKPGTGQLLLSNGNPPTEYLLMWTMYLLSHIEAEAVSRWKPSIVSHSCKKQKSEAIWIRRLNIATCFCGLRKITPRDLYHRTTSFYLGNISSKRIGWVWANWPLDFSVFPFVPDSQSPLTYLQRRVFVSIVLPVGSFQSCTPDPCSSARWLCCFQPSHSLRY